MVKTSNTRVALTLSKKAKEMLQAIANTYGMTESAVMQMLIVVFHNERMNK